MALDGAVGDSEYLVLIAENGDVFITEDGDRIVAETPNAATGTLTANGTITPFTGELQVKNSSIWQAPEVWVRHGGIWKQPVSAYVNDNGQWKRML